MAANAVRLPDVGVLALDMSVHSDENEYLINLVTGERVRLDKDEVDPEIDFDADGFAFLGRVVKDEGDEDVMWAVDLMQRVLYKDPQGKLFVVYDDGKGNPVQNSF